MIRLLSLLVVSALVGFVSAEDKPKKRGVVETIPVVKADKLDVKFGKWSEPAEVKTEAEMKKLIADEATQKRLAKEIDFETHVLLVFAWQGSGGDKLDFAILESFPEQVKISLKPGATDDLRKHIQLVAVKKECRWSAK